MSVSYNFKNRRVLVTGGAKGLGRGIVSKFIASGATVFALDRDEASLKVLKNQFPNVETICVDLLNWDASKKAVEALAPIHHLVNNAGIAEIQTFREMTPEFIDRTLGVNFKSVINMGQAVVKGISEKGVEGGTIVNISSIMDSITLPGIGMYSSTKAGVTMMTKVMALELGPLNIRVNCVRPTVMHTELISGAPQEVAENVVEKCLGRQVTKRLLTVDETADAVLFLSSDASAMINGTDILIDGGFYTN